MAVAGHAAGIPVVAVQHGILYAGHAGLSEPSPPRAPPAGADLRVRPFERDVLLDLAYEPDEVLVTGSPRLDLDAARRWFDDARTRPPSGTRYDVSSVSPPADRLVLVSTVNLRFVQRSHFVHMLEAILGASLPGVHVVFKLHPGERDEGPYRQLLLGIARASGYPAPPISVVKDIDLYRLLRAADAHLGLLSTVLTEAVVTGTPNLIAMTDGHVDLLGYVAAGVARPVRTPSELLQALDQPDAGDPARRQAFLDRHFLPGDASARIIDTVAASIASSTAEPVR